MAKISLNVVARNFSLTCIQYSHVFSSICSSVTPQDSVEMPQTNKSVSGGSVPGQVSVPDQGEPPPQDVRTQVAAGGGDGGGAAEDQGDPEIIKSPSDPKKYRWDRTAFGSRSESDIRQINYY